MRNIKSISSVLLFLSFLNCAQAAVPVVNPKCASDVKVKSVSNGSGVYFSEDCKTAFVLPPAVGEIAISGLSPSMALQQCGAFQSVFNVIKLHYNEIQQLAERMNGTTKKPHGGNPGGGPLEGDGPLSGKTQTSTEEPASETERLATLEQYKQMIVLAKQAQTLLEPFKAMVASTGQLIFKSSWDKLVDEYQKANPQFRFVRMPMSVRYLNYARKVVDKFESMPAARAVIIPGTNRIELIVHGQGPETNVDNLFFGEALSGQIELTLAGACPFYDIKRNVLKSNLTARDLSPYFTANVQYKFSLLSTRNYSASYNLSSMVKRVQEVGSHGGFFSSSSYSKLLIEKNSSDWFKFTSTEDDSRFGYNTDSLRAKVKADLINRVAKEIVRLSDGNPNMVPAPGAPGPHGAHLAARAVAENCPNLYCQAGAGALNVLDAIFGSSAATSTFINNNNYWANEEVNESKMLSFTGSYTFAGASR